MAGFAVIPRSYRSVSWIENQEPETAYFAVFALDLPL
jgi:hypothetical protein